RNGAYDYHVKPVASEKMVLSLRHAYDMRRMRSYITRLEQHIAEQGDISAHEKEVIFMNQMHHMLVDENGELKSLKALEREIIEAALRYTNGCVSRAARSLGIGRSTLYRKVGEYDIPTHNGRDIQTTRPNMLASSASSRASG
ncbi:MAG: helix-turn-helix domain-containing protein, partial [Alphaproteobacteria bacterium]